MSTINAPSSGGRQVPPRMEIMVGEPPDPTGSRPALVSKTGLLGASVLMSSGTSDVPRRATGDPLMGPVAVRSPGEAPGKVDSHGQPSDGGDDDRGPPPGGPEARP